MEAIYPQFYRKGRTCIFRENDVRGQQIEILDPDGLGMIHTKFTYPDKRRFDKAVMDMELVPQELYERYSVTYRQFREGNPKQLRAKGQSLLGSELLNNQPRT